MSKLKSNHLGSKVQPEVIGLVHDEVVSLCHKMYSSVSGLEIDGIICISLLDTKEQQVVKIHKTLKSVVADVTRKSASSKNNAYPKITSILSAGNSGSVRDHLREEMPDREMPNFQQDIRALNDLLKASNQVISANAEAALESPETLEGNLRSKRKRKQPHHRSDYMYDAENEDSQEMGDENTDTAVGNGVETNEEPVEENVDMTCDTITVKEEPRDPGYEDSEDLREINLAGPKEMEYSNVSSKDNERETPENDVPEFGNREQRDSSASTGRSSAPPDLGASDTDLVQTKVKSENTEYDSEYGLTVEQSSAIDAESVRKETDQDLDSYDNQNASKNKENQNEEVPREWLYPDKCDYESLSATVRKSQEAEKHWLFGLAEKGSAAEVPEEAITDEVTRTVLMDKYYEAHKARQPKELLVGRQEKDPSGRSWIQMVNANVNRYQQALMRSVRKKQSDELAGGSASGLLKSLARPRSSLINADHLKALLKEPPLQTDASRQAGDVEHPARNVRDKSLTLNTASSSSDRSSSASVSPAPVVKIEVDEEQQTFPPSEENPTESTQESDKPLPPSGKLESRYPALFNQLQQAKKDGQPPVDLSDSLVNRLPFISFQELFAPANPSTALPRMSDSITKQLLEQAKVSPLNQRVTPPKKKSVWKWKKRYVKPKANEGRSVSPSLSLSPVAAGSSDETDQRKRLGINMSAKKTFARKRVKDEESSDKEWTPSESAVDEDVRDFGSGESVEVIPRKKIKTRLSTGEKPRINFAEIDISDIELEEEELQEEEPAEPIELVSAYCKNACGIRCTSFTALKKHEEHCTWIPTGVSEEGAVEEVEGAMGEDYKWNPIDVGESVAVGGMGVGVGSEGTGSTGEDYKCTLCGLDFNQEYRWHYHMVKVHGVAADKTVLFR